MEGFGYPDYSVRIKYVFLNFLSISFSSSFFVQIYFLMLQNLAVILKDDYKNDSVLISRLLIVYFNNLVKTFCCGRESKRNNLTHTTRY